MTDRHRSDIVGPAQIPSPIPRWRARPDGHQHWLRLELTPANASRLRRQAIEAGVTVDAWLGIALALQLARVDMPAEDFARRLREALPSQPLQFACNEKLRNWQRYLLECDGPGVRDELPEVVLGCDICAKSANLVLAGALALTLEEWELGRECELRAAAYGQPLAAYIRELANAA